MTDTPKKPRKSRAKKTKLALAEVIQLHQPDPMLIEMLEDFIDLAEEGRLTSIVGVVTVDGKDEIILMGRPDQPYKTIGILETVKAEYLDCVRSLEEEM